MLAHLASTSSAPWLSNLLILVGLTYLVSVLAAAHPPVRTAYRGAVFGLMLGVVAGILVFVSVKVGNGVLLDLRYVVILMSGLLGGPVAAIVTAALTLLFRLEIGGSVVVPAIGDRCGGGARRRRENARRQVHLARLACAWRRAGGDPRRRADAVVPARQPRPRLGASTVDDGLSARRAVLPARRGRRWAACSDSSACGSTRRPT